MLNIDRKELILVSDPFPPYQYFDQDGQAKGLDCELCCRVLSAAGYDCRVVLDDWSLVNDMLAQGQADALFQVAATPERLEKYFFSTPYRYAYTDIVTAVPDWEVSSYEELAVSGRLLATISGYVYGEAPDALPPEMKVAYGDAETQLRAVASGAVDCAVFDRGVKELLCDKLGIKGLRTLAALSFSRPIYIMFNDAQVRDAFNAALEGQA